MTAAEAIQLYRETKASRHEPPAPAVQHDWRDGVPRKPVPGGFRIYPIEFSEA